MSEAKWVLLFIVGVIFFIVFLVYMSWLTPSVRTHLLNWGKQVCIDIKPARSFSSHMTCRDIE